MFFKYVKLSLEDMGSKMRGKSEGKTSNFFLKFDKKLSKSDGQIFQSGRRGGEKKVLRVTNEQEPELCDPSDLRGRRDENLEKRSFIQSNITIVSK